MVLYDERGACFAQTPLVANETKHTQYNSERKDNFGSPALASEAILRSHGAVVSSPDLNSLSNEVSRSHLRGLTDKGIMGYENNFQTSENQTSLSFSGDCVNYSQEISKPLMSKETVATFDLKEQMQKFSTCQESEIFMNDMYQTQDQQKEQDPLSFVNDFLVPPASFSDENKNIDNLNYPLNYSNSFLSGTTERSNDIPETILPDNNSFEPSPASSSDTNEKKNPQPNSTPEQPDLQSLLDLLEPPPKKRRGRPLGSKNSDKKTQPGTQVKKAPKRKNNTPNPPPTQNSKQARVGQQTYQQTMPSYPQVPRFTQGRPEHFSQTKAYLPPVLPQQTGPTQQSLAFSPQTSEFSHNSPLNFTQQQFIQQPSGSKSKFSPSPQNNFSPLLPNTQTDNFSHFNPQVYQQIPPYQTCNYTQQQLPKFSQLSASLKSPPQYPEYYGQPSGNTKPDYVPVEYQQQFHDYKTVPKTNVSYLQAPPNYSEHLFKYSQPFPPYGKNQDLQNYYQNYPHFYDQTFSGEQLEQVQNFPRLIDDYNQIASQFQGSFQSQRPQELVTQNIPPQKPEIAISNVISLNQNQRYQAPNHQNQKCGSNASEAMPTIPNRQIQNHQAVENHQGAYQQFPGQMPKYSDPKGMYDQMKMNAEYEQKTKSTHYPNGAPYSSNYHPDGKFLPPSYQIEQNLNQPGDKFFRSWHTPEAEVQIIDKDNKIEKFMPMNTASFLKDFDKRQTFNFPSINSCQGYSPMCNTTNYPKFASDSENLLQEKSSNFHDAGTRQYVNDGRMIPNLPHSGNFLPTNTLSKDENDFLSSIATRNYATSPMKSLMKQFGDYEKPKEGNVAGPNYFQLPNGERVLSITASWLDSQARKLEKNEETRDWLVKSPAPLEIICPESQKRKRKVYRTEYRPHKGIKYAVKRYRANGFSTRSPCPKTRERDPLALDSDEETDTDDNDYEFDDYEDDNNNNEFDNQLEQEEARNQVKETKKNTQKEKERNKQKEMEKNEEERNEKEKIEEEKIEKEKNKKERNKKNEKGRKTEKKTNAEKKTTREQETNREKERIPQKGRNKKKGKEEEKETTTEKRNEEEQTKEKEGRVTYDKQERNDSQDTQYAQDNNTDDEHNAINNKNSCVQNNANVLKNCTTSEEKNLPTALDIITGRWTRMNGFKKSEIHHQGLPNLQLICKSEFNKTANSKQTKTINLESKRKQSLTTE